LKPSLSIYEIPFGSGNYIVIVTMQVKEIVMVTMQVKHIVIVTRLGPGCGENGMPSTQRPTD